MRRTFRKHPRIVTKLPGIKKGYYDFVIGGEDDYGKGPGYEFSSNKICLNGSSEKHIIRTLNHEITHWAFLGYLTEEEEWKSFTDTINWQLSKAPYSLFEKVARFVAGRLT